MVTFYLSKSVYSGAERVLSDLKKSRGRSIIIVPDAFTLSLETGALTRLGREGSFDVEVMSFARLASVALGKNVAKCLSPAGSVLLMEKVIRRLTPELRAYGRSARKAGFAAEMFAAVTAIRNSGISPETLAAAVDKLRGYVREKTADIVLLYKGYLEELALEHTDSTTRLEALAAEIRAGEGPLLDADFYVIDYIDFNAKQLDVLSALMEKARSVTVSVVTRGETENRRVYPAHPLRRLRDAARKAGVVPTEIVAETELTEAKGLIADKLFSYVYKESISDYARIAEAKDAEEEVTLLATEIVRLVRREGLRYRDVAIISPTFEEYLPYVERIFGYYDIPFFADARYRLSESDLFDHILTGAELTARNFDRVSVGKYLSHALFTAATPEEKAFFDDYVVKYGVDRSTFTRPFALGADDPLYETAERVRAAMIRELSVFLALPAEESVRAYAEIFRNYLAENEYDKRIDDYAKDIHEAGYLKEANVIGQTPACIVRLLDTITEIRGEEKLTKEEFLFALRSGAEQIKIAALPVSLDCVYFAPVEQAMYEPIGAMFLLGAEEGLFPLEIMKEGILGEREYAAWQSLDIVVENTGVEELGASRFHALQLLLRPERLYMSYKSARAPSVCVKQLANMFSVEIKSAERLLAENYDEEVLLPTVRVAENYLTELSRKEREGTLTEGEKDFASAIAEILGREFPLSIYETVPERTNVPCFFLRSETSVSEIESYYKCPFAHFVRYGLRARERDTAERDRADFGTFVHACLQTFMARKQNRALDDEATRARAREIAENILREPQYQAFVHGEDKQAVTRYVQAAVIAVSLANKQVKVSDYEPTFFEATFGEGRRFSAVDVNGVRLTGKIDRVDIRENDVCAIDYKTGNSEFSLQELYYGTKIQLQMYLIALAQAGYKPTAALYADASGAVKSGKKTYFSGQVLRDYAVASALDHTISNGKASFTGLATEDGSLIKDQKGKTLTEEEMQAMLAYTHRVAEHAVTEIRDGYITPSPVEGSCKYCDMAAICHFEGVFPRKAGGSLDAALIEALIASEGESC